MRILFIIMPDDPPSTRIRVLDLMPSLADHGIVAEAIPLPWDPLRKRRLFARAADYDAVILQKILLSGPDLRGLRRRAKRLAYDFDDAIYLKPAFPSLDPMAYDSPMRLRRFARTVESTDMILAANSVLASKAQELRPSVPIAIIPSAVADDLPAKTDYNLGNPAVMGWVGVGHNLAYLQWLAPALREVASRHDCVLRILSDRPLALRGVKVEHRRWRLETQNEEIRRFDVGIMPLSPDPYSLGKAAYKLLQYLAAGVPSIASAVGMNCEVSDGERNCLLARDIPSFADSLTRLLGDGERRETLGRNGRTLVAQRYTRTVVAALLADTLRRLTAS
jgi:glycosyltransferase involved in cell wall biosynthesis